MSSEDPFFVVKDEVQKAVSLARGLYERWCDLLENPGNCSREEYEWTTNELRNALRSIDWDLEDLEETISIVERNPKKFKIDTHELMDRRQFVNRTKDTVKDMKEHMSSPQTRTREDNVSRQTLITNGGPVKPQNKYMRLENEIDRANSRFIDDTQQQQTSMINDQDETIERIGGSVGVLKNMSSQIGNELDEQAVMLDDFAHEMDTTDTKMDNVMKKMAKVLHMSNDKRQWCAIGILILIMVIVIVLFFVL